MFCNSNLSKPFGIFTQYPRSLLRLDVLIACLEGALVVEEGDNLIDPLLSLRDEVEFFVYITVYTHIYMYMKLHSKLCLD